MQYQGDNSGVYLCFLFLTLNNIKIIIIGRPGQRACFHRYAEAKRTFSCSRRTWDMSRTNQCRKTLQKSQNMCGGQRRRSEFVLFLLKRQERFLLHSPACFRVTDPPFFLSGVFFLNFGASGLPNENQPLLLLSVATFQMLKTRYHTL